MPSTLSPVKSMSELKCFGCQQVFDKRKALFGHLQQNVSHKQGKATSKKKAARARSQPQTQTQMQPQPHTKTRDVASAIVGEVDARAEARAESATQNGDNDLSWWCVSVEQEAHLHKILPGSCHPLETLRTCQYRLENRTQAQLEQTQSCVRCQCKRNNPRRATQPCVFHADRRKVKGKRYTRARTCCTQSHGCQTSPKHTYPPVVYDDFRSTPGRSTVPGNAPKRFAVVIDCEMVEVAGGSSELAQLCIIDLVTAEVLLNSLVLPTEKVTDWRTRYSGISSGRMALAVSNGEVLQGWQAAQTELWKYVDGDTILVGHALQHDLKALHLIHHRVLDTSILTRNAVGSDCNRSWSLKVLCAELAKFVVQDHGAQGHDCLEDTMATREVFLRCVLVPETLWRWADQKRAEEQARALARDMVKLLCEQGTTALAGYRTVPEHQDDDSGEDWDDSEHEVLHWSDIAEDRGWPHPDTGYDPWSD